MEFVYSQQVNFKKTILLKFADSMFITVSVDTHITFNIKYTHSESGSSLKQTIMTVPILTYFCLKSYLNPVACYCSTARQT